MEDYQERVIEEKLSLDERYEKLDTFMCGEVFCTLPESDRILMIRQLNAMLLYSILLGKRIRRF